MEVFFKPKVISSEVDSIYGYESYSGSGAGTGSGGGGTTPPGGGGASAPTHYCQTAGGVYK